jgi:FemAB-related protein (PEP-CTERM system-associated)
LQKAVEIATNSHADYLEIRGNPYGTEYFAPAAASFPGSFKQKDLYFTFIGEIDPNEEVNLSRIPRKQRRMIRQAQKFGLRSVIDNSRLREFYEVYAESVRNLGTPVYAYHYFQHLLDTFGEQCKVLLVEYQGKVVASVLSFLFKDQVLPYYGGALKEYFHLAPNDFMYWELMSFAAANGIRTFDFGRSKAGTGPYNFKRHWGFEPCPLPYWYYPVAGKPIPDTSPLNPKLQWAIRIWRNLPLRVTMALGPHIVRHIP